MRRKQLIQFVFSLIITLACNAQDSKQDDNLKYIDSVEKEIKIHLCNDKIAYPIKYNKKGIKSDKEIIYFLNKMFKEDFTPIAFDNELSKLKKSRKSNEEKVNGLLRVNHLILNGNYLRVEARIEFIDNVIHRKYFTLSTTTNGRCGESNFRVLDFKLLKEYFLRDIDFNIFYKNTLIESTKFSVNKIEVAAKKYTDYSFNIPEINKSDIISNILLNQYNSDSSCCYSFLKANKIFVKLIKEDKVDIIRSLLFSPNYFYSINAMEVIMYLNSINKITIDDKMKEKINAIKNGTYQLTIQRSEDSFMTVKGYKEIKTTDEAVIMKIKNSIEKD
jgi:hypothetical protein